MTTRIKSALLLAPAILLLLLWIAVYGRGAELLHAGIPVFLGWAVATSLAIAYCITLYVTSLRGK